MNRFLGFIFLGFFAASVLSVNTASTGHAQTADDAVHDRLFLENVEKFEEWRRNIPDYEKRLYDRVKGINERVIRVTRLVIASFILLLIFNYIFLVFIYRRTGGKAGTPAPSDPAAETSEDGAPATTLSGVTKDTVRGFSRFFLKSAYGISRFFLDTVPDLLVPVVSRIGKHLPEMVEAPAGPLSSEVEHPPVTPLRSFQDLVLRGFDAREYSRAHEIRIFAISFLLFAPTYFLLVVINPHQLIYRLDEFHYYQQVISQIANGNPIFGFGANFLINGGIDFAVNGHLLPAFYLASFFSDLSAPITTYTILSIELFVTMYISCRMFRLPVHVAMLTAWLTPLLLTSYVYPPVVQVEPLLVTPFLITEACLMMLSVALFYRLGKSDLRNTLVLSCGLFVVAGYVALSFLYFFVIYGFVVIWPCLALFIFASSMKERIIKAVAGLVMAGVFYVVFYEYLDNFYKYNWGYLLDGTVSGGGQLLGIIRSGFVTTFTTFEGFLAIFSLEWLPMHHNQRYEFRFATIFLYGGLASGLIYAALFANRYKSEIFQLSIAFLFSLLGPIFWGFGNFEALIAPLFSISFVFGIIMVAQILGHLFKRWLPAMGVPARLVENGIMFIGRHNIFGRIAPGGIILNTRRFAYLMMGGAFAVFLFDRIANSPDSRTHYEYGARPDMESYRILERDIGINHSPVFRGRLVGQAFVDDPYHHFPDPYDPSGKTILRDILNLRRTAARKVKDKYGGDHIRTVIQDRIPILHDNNRFTSPGPAVIENYLLFRPEDVAYVQNHNISLFNRRLLEMLGVRFVMRSEPLDEQPGVILRKTEKVDRFLTLYLYELPGANTGTFSPTSQVVFSSAKQALGLVGDPALDFRKSVLVEKKIPGPLVPARSSQVKIDGNMLTVEARSDGKSLVVLPFEFSHCLRLEQKPGMAGPVPKLLPVNLGHVGMVFERAASVTIRFSYTPFNAACRKQDLSDWKNLKITELRTYKGVKYTGGYAKYGAK